MKRIIVLFLAFLLFGCTYGTDEFKHVVTDPHFARHQEKLDTLEKSYLAGELSYPDYLSKKKQLEDDYTKEVQVREEKIHQ